MAAAPKVVDADTVLPGQGTDEVRRHDGACEWWGGCECLRHRAAGAGHGRGAQQARCMCAVCVWGGKHALDGEAGYVHVHGWRRVGAHGEGGGRVWMQCVDAVRMMRAHVNLHGHAPSAWHVSARM
eukprot:359585-Chlamydomonas_euryale.AAC.1